MPAAGVRKQELGKRKNTNKSGKVGPYVCGTILSDFPHQKAIAAPTHTHNDRQECLEKLGFCLRNNKHADKPPISSF